MTTHSSHALLALALTMIGAGAFAQPAAPDAAWIAEATAVCANCHGAAAPTGGDGAGLAPKLGGQRAAYFESALRSYRGSSRDHFFMRGIAAGFSRDEVRALASYFASTAEAQPPVQPAAAPPPAVVQRCLACHLPPARRDAEFPVLHGQHEAYLEKALGDYVSGRQTNPTMRAVVAAEGGKAVISQHEITEAARWFASQEGLTMHPPAR